MAVAIKGKQISWGIPSAAKTASDALVSGIVSSFRVTRGGASEDIPDEDGDLVARVDHGKFNTVSFESRVATATPSLPEIGAEITGLGTIDGVAFGTGRVFIESAEITHQGTSSTTVSFGAKHYPIMVADA
jgi:hypothetical protein